MPISNQFYQQWRSNALASLQLKESHPHHIPERVLHLTWMHQRFDTEQCSAHDGRRVEVLHPGFWNHGTGPDFRSAVLKLGEQILDQCDIEIDVKPAHWRNHRHDLNPAFNRVRLHVVWNGAIPNGHPLPVLSLADYSKDHPDELQSWAGESISEIWPEWIRGHCASPLAGLDEETLQILVRQASLIRLQNKARRIEEDARQLGFRDALWRHLFTGLGYRRNQWPMRRIAMLRQSLCEGLPKNQSGLSLITLQARLFGIANLLNEELPKMDAVNQAYLKKLWDAWWRDRDQFAPHVLPKCIWHLQGIRPANHPLRRLATAAHWLMKRKFMESIEDWIQTPMQVWTAHAKMMELLGDFSDDFWSWHWTLKGPAMKRPSPLMGPERTNDLVVNVLLPWFLARSRQAGREDQVKRIERLYLHWPRSADNALLKLVRNRLLRGNPCQWIKCSSDQQGLLQILADYCTHSSAICENCLFPEVIKSLQN